MKRSYRYISFFTIKLEMVKEKGFITIIVVGYIISLWLINFEGVANASFLAIPHFQNTIYKLYSKCNSSTYNYPIALVTMSEHIGDYTVLN